MGTIRADILAPKITKLCFGLENFWHQNIGKKCALNIDENDTFRSAKKTFYFDEQKPFFASRQNARERKNEKKQYIKILLSLTISGHFPHSMRM